jgi:tryptophan halogenase
MIQNDQPVSRIAIFGKGHELWPIVALLSKNLPERVTLIIVEDTGDPAERAALTLPGESRFHAAIGISVEDIVLGCNGALGLGIDFQDWHSDGSRFFAALSGTLPAINGVALHHIMLRAAQMYHEPEKLAYLFQPFRFAARTALAGKFALPSGGPNSPLTMLGSTIQCDRTKYSELLKQRFAGAVKQKHDGQPVGLSRSPDNGSIHSVILSDGQEIVADFFVDASGPLSKLLPDNALPRFQSLSDILSFDRLISGFSDAQRGVEHGHTSARAVPGGLLIDTPLGKGVISELLFSSKELSEAAAQQLVGGDARAVTFEARFIETPWIGNLARLGRASATLGPYFSADMLLLHDQALHLAETIPAAQQMDIEATEFNLRQMTAIEQIRDFVLLPLALNRQDCALWTGMRSEKLPESLQIRLDQFNSRGRFVTFDNELFDQQLWIEMMIGFGLIPERYDPSAQAFDMQRIAPVLKKIVDGFTQAIDAMPEHFDFMENFVAAARSSGHPD